MCKHVFIGTFSELKEFGFDEEKPDLYLERLPEEYIDVKQNFSADYIYYVGTSWGCSCDLGMSQNLPDTAEKSQYRHLQNILKLIRKSFGVQESWEGKVKEKQEARLKKKASFMNQTVKLIEIIEQQASLNLKTELYCCWAGNYKSLPDESIVVKVNEVNLRTEFEIIEGQFVVYH